MVATKKHMAIIICALVVLFGGLVASLNVQAIESGLTLTSEEVQTLHSPEPTGVNSETPIASVGTEPYPTIPENTTGPGQEQATVFAQDTFQRTDQPLWGIASDQQSWEGNAQNHPAFSIVENNGRIATTERFETALLGPTSNNIEIHALARINRFDGKSAFGVVLRWVDDQNWYSVELDGQHLTLVKNIQGQQTVLKSIEFTANGDVQYALKVRAIGAILSVKAWRADATEPEAWLFTAGITELKSGRFGVGAKVSTTCVVDFSSFQVTSARIETST